jgi:tetratricopeptide (TPR) repeat protein
MSTTNHNNQPLLDDESLPPVDWDPAADADEGWTRVVSLMNNADTAPRLATADADGLRAALREQLLAEGILASGKKAEVPAAQSGSFLLWLRMLLVGGGAGGQVLRLGVVAFVAVAGTVEYTTLDSAPMTSARIQDRLAQPRSNSVTQSRRQVAEGVAGNADASLAAEERVLGKQKLESTEGAARLEETAKEDMERAAPPVEATVAMADDSRGDFDEFRDSNAPSTRAAKSVTGFAASAPSTSGMMVDAGMGGSGGQLKTITQAMEALQVAKFTAVLNDNASTLSDLRLVEQTLAAALSEIHRVPDDVRYVVQALERYRSAEDLLDGKRYQEAEDTFEEARRTSPRSFIGFLSQFQVARIRYEHTQDFAGALGAYRSCLDDYPREFLTDEYRDYVRERIEILTRTAADNWKTSICGHNRAMRPLRVPQRTRSSCFCATTRRAISRRVPLAS